MQSMSSEQSYYLSLEVEGNNVSRQDHALIPNCSGLCVLPKPFETYMQQGREDYYIQYLVRGEMRVWLDGEQRMRPGQAVLYYPHTAYRYAQWGEGPVEYYWLHFTGRAAGELVEGCRLPNAKLLTVGRSAVLLAQFQGLFHDFLLRDCCFIPSAASRLLSICVELGRRAEGGQADPEDRGADRVYRALSYIHQHYDEKLPVTLLAQLEHLSPSRFRRLFREATGLSPLEYVSALRMNQACQLLARTDLSLGEVARAVGYQDQFYFSRLFKERTGSPPSTYRKGP